jgi:hypothetical protein
MSHSILPAGKRSAGTETRKGLLKGAVMAAAAVGLAAWFGSADPGHASQKSKAASARAASALSILDILPASLRDRFRSAESLSSRQMCRVAEGLVRAPDIESLDIVARYLAKDVHGWSDHMFWRLLRWDPDDAKSKSKSELQEWYLEQWASDREWVQRWLQGCGVMVTLAINRGRGHIGEEGPMLLADIVGVIAAGVRRNDPDAIAAAEALSRAEQKLTSLLK